MPSYYSKVQYTGDGATATFSVPFPYIDRTHVSATVAGAAATISSWPTSGSVTLSATPASGTLVEIKRTTPRTALVTYPTPSTLKSSDLNTEATQLLYLSQEALDASSEVTDSLRLDPLTSAFTARSKRITNVADPIADSDATTKAAARLVAEALVAGVVGGTGSFTQAGTGAVARTFQDKMRDAVSVKDFGAVGDGVANDQPAFALALATGKSVYVPAGTYKLNDNVDLTANYQTLFGHRWTSVLAFAAGKGVRVNPADITYTGYVSVESLTINGDATSVGVDITRSNIVSVADCYINGPLVGVRVGNTAACNIVYIKGNKIINAGVSGCVGIQGRAWLGLHILDNEFQTAVQNPPPAASTALSLGTVAGSGGDTLVVENNLAQQYKYGMFLQANAAGKTIQNIFSSNNIFDGITGNGLYVEGSNSGGVYSLRSVNDWFGCSHFAGFSGSSTTSITIGVGSKVFTTQAGLAFVPNSTRVRARSLANAANFVEGVVTAYSGTSLTVNVDVVGGSGTLADWRINSAADIGSRPMYFVTNTGGAIDGMQFTNSQVHQAGYEAVLVSGSGCTRFHFSNCKVEAAGRDSANAGAFNWSGGEDFQFIGGCIRGTVPSTYSSIFNAGYGLIIATDITEYTVIGPKITAAVAGQEISVPGHAAGSKSRLITGIRGAFTPTVSFPLAASAVANVNKTPFTLETFTFGGTVSGLAKNATNINGMTAGSITLAPGESIMHTYSVAPTLTVVPRS